MKQLQMFSKFLLIATLFGPIHIHAVEATQTNITAKSAAKVTVQAINHNRVKKAQDDYAVRAQWAPFIKYSLYGAGVGITVASFFAYYWNVSSSKLTSNEIRKLRGLLANKPFINLFIKQDVKESSWEFMKGASSFGMFLATGIAQSVGTAAISYGTSSIAGDLNWYIANHTAYTHNLIYLKQSFVYYAIFKESIATTTQLLLRDIEKILGYLEYCKEVTFNKKSSSVKAALQNHSNFIEEHANAFAQAINNDQLVEQLIASMTLLETDITQATKFIRVYS